MPLFLCAVLTEPAILAHLGAPETRPAALHGFHLVDQGAHPLALAPEGTVQGLRLDHAPEGLEALATSLGLSPRALPLSTGETAEVWAKFVPEGAPCSQEAWSARFGAAYASALPDLGAPQRLPSILARAASALRAAISAPATLRRGSAPADVSLLSREKAYAKFFAVEDLRLRHRRFDGTLSAALDRAAFISTDAVVILPYDPATDRVLLVEQFRMGPYARGDANPWSLEGIAGRIDAGETPEEAGAREGLEEAGLAFTALLQAPCFYPSPGAKTEFLYCYLGLCDLATPPSGSSLRWLNPSCRIEKRASVMRAASAIASGSLSNATSRPSGPNRCNMSRE